MNRQRRDGAVKSGGRPHRRRRRSLLYAGVSLLAAPLVTLGVMRGVERIVLPERMAGAELVAAHGLFSERCAGCHALEPGATARFGPNLAEIGAVAASRRPELSAAAYIHESIAHPDAYRAPGGDGHMPAGLLDGVPTPRIRELVAYLAGLGAAPDAADIASLEIDPIEHARELVRPADVELVRRGEALYFDTLGCAGCHALSPLPGARLAAPSLARAGTLGTDYLAQSVREPSAVIAAGYRPVVVSTTSGESIRGSLYAESVDAVRVLARAPGAAPVLRRVERDDIEDLEVSDVSPMPPYALSADDEAALIAYLRSLNAVDAES